MINKNRIGNLEIDPIINKNVLYKSIKWRMGINKWCWNIWLSVKIMKWGSNPKYILTVKLNVKKEIKKTEQEEKKRKPKRARDK